VTTARLHIIRRILLRIQGSIAELVCEIEIELQARGWQCERGAHATAHDRRGA